MGKDADVSYAKIRKFVEDDGYRIKVSTEHHIVTELSVFDAVLPHISNRKWALLKCADSSAGFITCDHPVCLMWSDPKQRGPIGFKLRGTEIVFPICSRLAIVGAFELQEDEIDAPEDMVAAVNGMMIRFAKRHVYARDLNFRYCLTSDGIPRKASRLRNDMLRLRRKEG